MLRTKNHLQAGPRPLAHAALALVVAAGAWCCLSAEAQAVVHSFPDDIFYNYYVPPGTPAGVGAAMYPCPRPTPPLVGHTYVTYQPLRPQEFLWEHHKVYWRENPCAGWTRTSVCWKHCPTLWPFVPSLRWSVPGLHLPPAVPPQSCVP